MRKRALFTFLIVAGFSLVVGGYWLAHRGSGGRFRLPEVASSLPNTRLAVRYVGDQACVGCHAEIAEKYRKHPMGRSIVPVSQAPEELLGAADKRELFQSQGFHYSTQRTGGHTSHFESRQDSQGKTLGEVEGEVTYLLGSGRHAVAFLIQKGDYLFQSPITWYSQSHRWDLAPGYETRDARFERQITPNCLVCHANRVRHVPGTEGRYEEPIFVGSSIGCERCHGPGELHVAHPTGDSSTPLIVNPRKLSSELREDVCRQCHLLGETTVVKYGRELADYRPGLPLDAFLTVFVKKENENSDHPNADHVEQMERSRCFRASEGKLGCISCHDPHELPSKEGKVAFFRSRCLSCHAEKGCSVSEAERLKQEPSDSCVSCHMPVASTSDVPHVSTTLHSIPRFGKQARAGLSPPSAGGASAADLVPFHRQRLSEQVLKSMGRDLGVALRHDKVAAAEVYPLLKKAIEEQPRDVLARESLGFVLWGLSRDEEALAQFRQVLQAEPSRESTLEAAALVSSKLRRHEESAELWKRAIAVDPWRSSFSSELAYDLTRLRRWSEAAAAAEQALRLNPASVEARRTLILAKLRAGLSAQAESEFQVLLEMSPGERESLERWFQSIR